MLCRFPQTTTGSVWRRFSLWPRTRASRGPWRWIYRTTKGSPPLPSTKTSDWEMGRKVSNCMSGNTQETQVLFPNVPLFCFASFKETYIFCVSLYMNFIDTFRWPFVSLVCLFHWVKCKNKTCILSFWKRNIIFCIILKLGLLNVYSYSGTSFFAIELS